MIAIERKGGYIDSLERQLAGATLLFRSRKENDIERRLLETIRETFGDVIEKGIIALGERDAEELIFSQEALFNQSPDIYNDHLSELLVRLEEYNVRKDLEHLSEEIKKAEMDHNNEKAHELLLLYQTKQNVLHSIKNKKYRIIS